MAFVRRFLGFVLFQVRVRLWQFIELVPQVVLPIALAVLGLFVVAIAGGLMQYKLRKAGPLAPCERLGILYFLVSACGGQPLQPLNPSPGNCSGGATRFDRTARPPAIGSRPDTINSLAICEFLLLLCEIVVPIEPFY